MRNNIALLVPYFGKLPPYYNAFVKTVAGKNVDILFFSDIAKPANLPANMYWYQSSLATVKAMIESAVGIPVNVNRGYKLCDFRPAFGLVFHKYLSDYTFWGSIDLDVCLGDTGKYLNDTVLASTDIFSGISAYVSGSFFLVRNNAYCNNLFRKSRDWQTVFQKEEYVGFDECGGRFFEQLKAGKSFEQLKPTVESFTEIILRETPPLRLCFNNVIAEPKKGVTVVTSNSVKYNHREYMMVHHIYYKTWYSFYTNKVLHFPFYVNRLGFFQTNPSLLVTAFSRNFWIAVKKKLLINLKKMKPAV